MFATKCLRHAHWFLVPLALLVSLGSVLLGRDRLAFRDVSHFYTPLYRYVAERTSQQGLSLGLPLWNPFCGTGMPLAGETTTAVFYPIRYLIFSLPLDAETAVGVYAFLHLWLAAVAATWLAKRAGVANDFSAFAGVLYALGGSVFFLHTNLPFLVGAAWLPYVLGTLIISPPSDQQGISWQQISLAGLALSMMVLGGDPQTALHAMMVVAIARLPMCFGLRRIRGIAQCLTPVIGAGLLAAALAAPQIAASVDWSRQSSRVASDERTDWTSAPKTGDRRGEAYQFSLPPWHLAELITPWASGSLFPVNQRVSQSIPGDGRTWTTTISMGILGLLGLVAATVGRNRKQFGWWPFLAWLSLSLSMGHFGLAWLVQQAGVIPNVDSALGGPYWFLYELFPFYDSYRYPTKWLPFFAIACAIVAALWTQAASQAPRLSLIRIIKIASTALLLIMTAVVIVQATNWNHEAAANLRDEYWGPLHYHAGLRQITLSIIQSATLLLVVSCLLMGWPKRIKQMGSFRWLLLLFFITAELTWCSVSMVAKIDRANEQQLFDNYGIAQSESSSLQNATRAMRMQSAGGWPESWAKTSSANRIGTIATAERAACFGRWHLDHRISVFNGMTSIRSQDLDTFWRVATRLTRGKPEAEQEHFWRSIQRWLQLDTVIHVDAARSVGQVGHELPHVTWRKLEHEMLPTANRFATGFSTIQKTETCFEQVLQNIVATNSAHSPSVFLTGNDSFKEKLEIIDIAVADSVSIAVDRPSLIVRPVYQDGNWTATLLDASGTRATQAEVCNVDFLKQGAIVPAGEWTVTFAYHPWWFTPTAIVALVAWLLLILSNLKAMVLAAGHSPDQVATAS